jgi:transcriptional regulator with XRE-family HTH domain
MEKTGKRLAENLKEYRRRLGWNQEKLAEMVDVSSGAVKRWETGKRFPKPEILEKIAEIFKITVSQLLSDSEPKQEPLPPATSINGLLKTLAEIPEDILNEIYHSKITAEKWDEIRGELGLPYKFKYDDELKASKSRRKRNNVP